MARRKFWQVPKLFSGGEIERKVNWLELFYDLAFVAAIAQLGHFLHGSNPLFHIGEFVILFIPLWWVWIGSAYYNDYWETFGIETRLMFLGKIIAVAGLGIFITGALEATYPFFIGSYILGRSIIIAAWLRTVTHVPEVRRYYTPMISGFTAAVCLCGASIFFEGNPRFILWGIGLAMDIIAPLLPKPRIQKSQTGEPHRSPPSKLPERIGLFIIIVLGESIIGIIGNLAEKASVSLRDLAAAALGIVFTFCIWWIYFDFVGRRPPKKSFILSRLWTYLHMPLILSITALGISISNMIEHPGEVTGPHALLFFGAAGAVLFFIGLIESILHREELEMTHPVFSPLLKIISGLLLVGFPFFKIHFTPLTVFIPAICITLLSMVYGLYVWFSQDLEKVNYGE
jgi:low temperature requirement protein LtrA